MNKLINASYKGSNLDQKIVNRIVSLLNRSDLKKYINELKMMEDKKNLKITCPVGSQNLEKFEKMFPNKKIILKSDPTLFLGVRIVDNDIVYDFTLKNSFDKILNYIEQNYD